MRITPLLLVLSCGVALAQPRITPGGVVNSASYTPGFMPNKGIAQGAMFVIFGSGLGPATLQQVSSYPLPTTQGLGGTTVTVTVGGTSVPCILIYTYATQVAAILPSRTPLGAGTVTLSYNGVPSNPAGVQVVTTSFGAFSLASTGSGPGVVQNIDGQNFPVNTFVSPARPGQAAVIWGTGLGAVSGNEATQAPTPRDMTNDFNIQVLVGGIPAPILYGGRSGCCNGIDEIVFEVPKGVEGCFVPVAVVTYGVTSNLTTMAIASSGSTCNDPFGFSGGDLQRGLSAGAMRTGSINLASSTVSLSAGGITQTTRTDTSSGSFTQATVNDLVRGNIVGTPSLGACIAATVVAGSGPQAASGGAFLDTGLMVNIAGPAGRSQMPAVSKGAYNAQLGTSFLQPGVYTVDNGAGGGDVGAFQAQLTIPPGVRWTNADNVNTLSPFDPLDITWTGADPNGAVVITGASLDFTTGNGAVFVCLERAARGKFTVPTYVLANMPATSGPVGILGVAGSGLPVKFSAGGLDAGYLTYTVGNAKNVTFVRPSPRN